MLTPEEEMQILKGALTQGYKGQVFKLIDQANLQKGQVAEEDSQQEQGLKGSDGNTAMAFPETEGDFNTEGMDFPIDIRKYDREGNLVKSYNKVPPGIKALDMGEDEGTVVENPSQYQKGGVKEYQGGGVDLNFGGEGSMNCGPGTGRGCGRKESRLTLKPNFNMSYNTGTKDIGGSLGLGLQSYLGGYDTRGGAPTIQAGIRGEGSVNALTLDSPNPETHINLLGSGKLGYTKRGTSGAHDWSSDNAGFNIGAYGDYDLSAKKMKELGIYGGYGKIQGNLGYDLQDKTVKAGIGLRFKNGGVRKYQKAGFDKDAFINQYLKEENTNTKKTSKNKGILSNTVSTTDGTKYYNKNGTPMNFDEKNTKIISDKKETIKYVKKSKKDIDEFLTDPVKAGDAMGMTGIPIVSEAGDLISAGASAYRGNYADASLSLAGIAVPFAGGAALKAGKNFIKAPSHSLYRVVDASGNVQAAKYGSHIPDATTAGRRSGRQSVIQKNTDFDHLSTTTDQKWLTEGKSNLFDRYGGKNPYVVKLQGHEGKIHQIDPTWKGISNPELAKIRPGSYTDMSVAGPQYQNITSIIGPKGGKVANVKGVMSKSQYLDALRLDPNFKFKKGGLRKYQAGNFKEKPKTLIESKPFFQYPQSVINTKRRKELKDAIDIVVSKESKDKQENMKELLTQTSFMENSMGHNPKAYNRSYTNSQASIDHIRVDDLFDERKDKDGKSQGYSSSQKKYFKRLEELGLPTDKAGFLKELSFDNPLAAIYAMRMTYGRSPKKIPSKEDPEKMFTYYNEEYRKNNKIIDLTKSKERFYEGYKMEFKKGGYRSKSCW